MGVISKVAGAINMGLGLIGAKIYRRSTVLKLQVRTGMMVPSTLNESPLPPDASMYLRPDNPRLGDLISKYRSLHHPSTNSSVWVDGSATRDIDLQRFRADNSFMYQRRDWNGDINYLVTAFYLQQQDTLFLFRKLKEDGLFGAETLIVDEQLTVSRDLLDSISEINFLNRHLAISGLPGLTILDIGAGYGRLAYRMVEALPQLRQYWCVDAIPTSTFISEYYLRFRGVQEKAKVIPLFDLDELLLNNHIDIAVNIHSFSEIPLRSISWWLEAISTNKIKYLMIVPNANAHDGAKLYSLEKDNNRQDFSPLLQSAGYRLIAQDPKYLNTSLTKYGVSPTTFYLFELAH